MAKKYLGTKLQELGNVSSLDPSDKIVVVKPKDEGVMELGEFFYYVQSNLDLSNYYTTLQSNIRYAQKEDVYTRQEANDKFAFLDRTYSKTQADEKYAQASEVYTKDISDNKYVQLGNTYTKDQVYSKDETFTTFALKTELHPPEDLSPYSTTAKGDLRWALKTDVYSKISSDAKYATLNLTYSREESDIRFAKEVETYTKSETDSKFLDANEGYTRNFIQNNIYFKPEVYTKLETDTRFALKNNVYTIAAVNEQFAAKSWVYSRGDAENSFAPKETTYSKTEVNTLVNDNFATLDDKLTGDYYTKLDSDAKYATLELTYSRIVSDDKYALISNTLTVPQLADKYYNKLQVDGIIDALDWTPYLTKTDAANTYATIATTLTKSAIESKYYTKAEVNDAIAAAEQGLQSDSAERYITSGYADEQYANINSVYTKLETDGKYATLALTYSRTAADARYYLKTAVDTLVANTKEQTLDTVAGIYLETRTAANTYITKTLADDTFAFKTDVYTKTESDSRYTPKDTSYSKSAADARFLKVGLNTLSVVDDASTGDGAVLNLTNTNESNNESGRVQWNNEIHEIGNVRISNTSGHAAYLALDLRENFTTAPARIFTVTPDHIEHRAYGKLDEYFATINSTYTRPVIDGMFTDIENNYTPSSQIRATYATIANQTVLENSVSDLSTEVENDRRYLDGNFYKKTDVYNKSESDNRYYNSSAEELEISGIGSDSGNIILRSAANGYYSGRLKFGYVGHIQSEVYTQRDKNEDAEFRIYLLNAADTLTKAMGLTDSGIWHSTYGNLHDYFALSSVTYTKTQVDDKVDALSNSVYSKTEANSRYALKTNLNALTQRVTTAENTLGATITDLSNNYYTKSQVFDRPESDNRYHRTNSKSILVSGPSSVSTVVGLVLDNTETSKRVTPSIQMKIRGDTTAVLKTLDTEGSSSELIFAVRDTGNNVIDSLSVTSAGIWHRKYGNLHAYFAKSSDTYSKTESNSRYYTKSDADGRYYQKSATYTRSQMDSRYALATEVYTETQTDSKFELKGTAYSKAQTDAKFYDMAQANAKFEYVGVAYTKAQANGRFALKTDSYTKAESNDRYYKPNDDFIKLTGVKSTGDGIGISMDNAHETTEDSPLLDYKIRGESVGYIFYNKTSGGTEIRFNIGTGSAGRALKITEDRVWHRTYGDLHDYFAKSSDTYSKVESDSRYYQKSDVYSKTEIDAGFYSTSQANARFALKSDSYTKSESDGRYYGKADVYSKTQSDGRYYGKSDVYTRGETNSKLSTLESNTQTKITAAENRVNDYADTAVDNIEIGGRNLIPYKNIGSYTGGNVRTIADSAFEIIGNKIIVKSTIKDLLGFSTVPLDGYTNETLILSCNSDLDEVTYYYKFNNGNQINGNMKKMGKLFYLFINVPTGANLLNIGIGVYPKPSTFESYYISGLKLEKGNKVTDWSPAPEDVAANIDKIASDLVEARQITNNNHYTKSESDGRYYGKSSVYTMSQSNSRYYTKSVSDGRYAYKADSYTKSESNSRYHLANSSTVTTTSSSTSSFSSGLVIDNTKDQYIMGSVQWLSQGTRNAAMVAYGPNGDSEPDSRFEFRLTDSDGVEGVYMRARTSGLWHDAYGFLHEYFAKSSELSATAGKVDSLETSHNSLSGNTYRKTDVYTKAETDARFYDTGQSNSRYALKTDSYTKSESNSRYYTKSDANARYAYKADSYTKSESNSRYYGKSDVYTKAQVDSKHAIPDTRNDNQTPDWYSDNYARGQITEFKKLSEIGLSAGTTYAELTTIVAYPGSSGGWAVQSVQTQTDRLFIRSGNSATAWSNWLEMESVSGAAGKYYTKAQSNSRHYSKSESNSRYYQKSDVYTKAQTDARFYDTGQSNSRYALKTDSYTKSEVYTRTQSNSRFEYKDVAYTKAESDGRYHKTADWDLNKFYREVARKNASVGAGWITVAEAPTARYEGDVYVTDGESGDHSFVKIHWMRSYNDSNFRVINIGGHTNRITGVRVLRVSDMTYGRKVLQVYVTTRSNYTVSIHSTGSIANYNHLNAVTPVVQNSISGYVLQGNELTGLDAATIAADQSIKTGEEFYAQNDKRVYHEGHKPHWNDVEGKPISSSYTSTSTSAIANSKAVKYAYDRANNTYTKAQTDAKFYDTGQADARYAYKADSYTKSESDGRYYTKSQSNSTFYSRTQANARYAYKADSYTKAESNGRYYTKSESDGRYYKPKTELNLDGNVLMFAYSSSSNVDHIWYDDGGNYFHFVADDPRKATTQSGSIKANIGNFKGQVYSKGVSVYNSTESNSRYYTKSEANGRYAYKADSYTKSESDSKFMAKNASITADDVFAGGQGLFMKGVRTGVGTYSALVAYWVKTGTVTTPSTKYGSTYVDIGQPMADSKIHAISVMAVNASGRLISTDMDVTESILRVVYQGSDLSIRFYHEDSEWRGTTITWKVFITYDPS